jgi:glycosyltransferase involved in cell wall biosynthesis
MQILIPDICQPNTYVHDLAYAFEELGHQVLWGDDNLFYSKWQPDVIACQWPEGYFRTSYFRIGSLQNLEIYHLEALQNKLDQVKKNTLILAFVHNIKPRPTGNRELDSKLEKLFQISYGSSHAFVHLSKQSISEIRSYYPEHIYKDKPSLIISHGLNEQLRHSYPLSHKEIEQKKIEEFRIFVPGTIRYWSELTFLIRAFIEARIPNKRLVIAGGGPVFEGRHPVKPLRRAAIKSIPGVSLFARRLNDEMLCREIVAADILVSPRLWATNSGIPYLAATFAKRCIGPNVGNLPDALKELNGIIFEPENPSSLARAMETAYNQRNFCFVPDPPCPSWRDIAQQIEEFIVMLKNQSLVQETNLN